MDIELEKRLDRIEKMTLLAAKNILTVDDLALLLGRSPKTIRNTIDDFPHYKSGKNVYFKRAEVEAHLCRVKHVPANEILYAR